MKNTECKPGQRLWALSFTGAAMPQISLSPVYFQALCGEDQEMAIVTLSRRGGLNTHVPLASLYRDITEAIDALKARETVYVNEARETVKQISAITEARVMDVSLIVTRAIRVARFMDVGEE